MRRFVVLRAGRAWWCRRDLRARVTHLVFGADIDQTTDAELLSRATVWAGSEPRAAGQAFNVTNGDQFRWSQLWPAFAKHVNMDYAEPQQMSLAEAMPTRKDVWETLVARHGLLELFDRLIEAKILPPLND